MASSANFEMSSADESSVENATSQAASAIDDSSTRTLSKPATAPKPPSSAATPFAKQRYQRTRSYDESFYNRLQEKKSKQDPKMQQQHDSSQQPHQQQQPKPSGTQTLRREPVSSNTAGGYLPPNDGPLFDAAYHHRRPYEAAAAAYYGSGFVYPYAYPPPFEPPAYMGPYGGEASNGGAKVGTLLYEQRRRQQQQQQQMETIYRSTPMLNYAANSYFGWHHRGATGVTGGQIPPTTPTIYRAHPQHPPSQMPDGKEMAASAMMGDHLLMSSASQGSISFEKELVGPFFNEPTSKASRQRRRGGGGGLGPCSSASSICDSSSRRNRVKLCIILSILVIIVAVLVAMGIAVYSQIKTQSSVVKLVRQYRTGFVVTGGRQLDYDADLLNQQSQSFKAKAKEFEKKIDSVFRESGLSAIYEGVEVTAFRFVVEPPGMEVQFNIKIKVNVQLQVGDILAVMDDAIRHNANGVFADATIDPRSLNVENQRLSSTGGGSSPNQAPVATSSSSVVRLALRA